MKILIDECIPRRLKQYLAEHEAETVPEAGFVGKQNGDLLPMLRCAVSTFS
jgi:predicted nuclease of predicted toxin-antitoxin system